MNDSIILFLVLLAVACQGFVAGTMLLAVAARFSSAANDAFTTFREAITPLALPLALLIAVVTMSGSLYMSEVKHFIPCHLCWVQRGLLYPQVLLFGLLVWRPGLIWSRRLAAASLLLCAPVSIYHYVLEWYPSLESSVCDPKNPCTLVWFRELGYVTLPLMALSAGLAMLTLLALTRTNRTETVEH